MTSSSPSFSSFLGKNPSPEAFAKYAKKHEIFLHPDVAFLVPTKTMGMGVFATRSLPVGTVVISCPEASGVSPYMKVVPTSPCISVLHASPAAMEDSALFVVLVLMSELCRPHSPWRTWLEICPHMDHHLFDLTPKQAAALGVAPVEVQSIEDIEDGCASKRSENSNVNGAGSSSGNSIWLTLGLSSLTSVAQALEELHVKERWALAQGIIASAPDVWPAKKATFGLFCACLAQVFSRNFHWEEAPGREGPYLLPGLDILNHSFTANTTFEVRGGGRKHAMAFTVVTTRVVTKGEQIYGCYGRIGAARFAVEFQFTTKAVLRNDFVRFSAASLATAATVMHYLFLAAASSENKSTDSASALIEAYLNGIHTSGNCDDAGPTGDWKPELFGSDSLAAVETVHKDMKRRVEQLQRLGILFDEGLYLARPYATWKDEEDTEGSATFRWSTPSEHDKEVAKHARLLATIVYLLSVPKAEYDELYHRITAEWAASRTAALARAVQTFIGIKVAAALRQQASLGYVFGSSARDAVRQQLIRDTLTSEIATLRYYADAAA